MDYKQVIVMRTDLNMRKGKMIAQGAHASNAALWGYELVAGRLPEHLHRWMDESRQMKICCRADSEQQLVDIYHSAIEAGLEAHLITDAGFTEFHGVPTKTCVSIGPDADEKIDKITGHLKLL